MALKEATNPAAAFVSDEDIAVDKDGKLCDPKSPEAVTLVASKGVPISRERARAYGLIEDDVSRAEKKAAEEKKKAADEAAKTAATPDKTEIIVGKSAAKSEDKAAAKTEDKSAGSSSSSSTPPSS